MLGPTFYIIGCTARNRLRVRLRRLRQPRYLIGAIVGVAYIYVTLLARMRGARYSARARRSRPGGRSADAVITALQTAGPTAVGLVLLALMPIAWIFPFDSGLLDFTESEVQFLFPAPMSRRALLLHRLMRSQLGLAFASIIPAVVAPTGISAAGRVQIAIAMWLLLVTLKVHYTGITLTRASLAVNGPARWRSVLTIGVMLAALATVVFGVIRAFVDHRPARPRDVIDLIGRIGQHGVTHVILWPFAALGRPLFAPFPGPFFASIAIVAAILAVNVAWVLQSDETLQEAAAAAAARRAAKQRSQSGQRAAVVRVRLRRFQLALAGRAELALAWKNVMQVLRSTDGAAFARYVAPAFAIAAAVAALGSTRAGLRGVAALAMLVSGATAGFLVLLGPQVLRTDLRDDLRHLELIKTWPIRASAVVRGEILGPAAMLTAAAWGAIAATIVLSISVIPEGRIGFRLVIALAAVLLAPAVIGAQYTIQNAAAVLFPAWVPLGTQRARGLDALGQRLVLLGGVMFTLVLTLVPGVVAGGLVGLALWRFVDVAALVPAALVCTGVIFLETLFATEALGPMFETMDLLSVERAE